MQPTTIKIPPELKARVVSVAAEAGKTVHAFLLEVIEQQTGYAERRLKFVADAVAAEAQAVKDGTGYLASDVHAYAKARAAGKKSARPKAVAWRK